MTHADDMLVANAWEASPLEMVIVPCFNLMLFQNIKNILL